MKSRELLGANLWVETRTKGSALEPQAVPQATILRPSFKLLRLIITTTPNGIMMILQKPI